MERPRGRRRPGHGRLRPARRGRGVLHLLRAAGPQPRGADPQRAAAPVDGHPRARRRRRRDLALQRAAHPQHPLRRPGAGARQRGPAQARPRTVVTGGVGITRIFEEAGLPAGVLQLLPGGAEVGQALVSDPHVRVISFTGSTEAGRKVGEAAGRHLKRAHLELGGNSAMVVLADADVEKAVNLAAWGSFFHQGQICMTTGRHLVHESVHDAFVEASRPRPTTSRSATRLRARSPSGRSSTRASATRSTRWSPTRRRAVRPRGGRGDVRRPLLPPHGPGRRHAGPPRLREEIFGPVARCRSPRGGGDRARHRERVRQASRGDASATRQRRLEQARDSARATRSCPRHRRPADRALDARPVELGRERPDRWPRRAIDRTRAAVTTPRATPSTRRAVRRRPHVAASRRRRPRDPLQHADHAPSRSRLRTG